MNVTKCEEEKNITFQFHSSNDPQPQLTVTSTCPSALQVHGHPGLTGDVRQHPWSGQQAAAAVPPTSSGDAGHRCRDEGLDHRVPASVPQPPLELQHHDQGPQPVWTPAATQ